MRTLFWFRADLRTFDNPALHAACASSDRGVIGVFVICPEQWNEHDWAACKVDLILRTLDELGDELEKLNIPLLVRTAPRFDDVAELLTGLAVRHECDRLAYNREYELNEQARDRAVTEQFEKNGLQVYADTDQVVVPPGSVRTKAGQFYTVFTPFRRAWVARMDEAGLPAPLGRPRKTTPISVKREVAPDRVPGFDAWDGTELWPAGERAARRRLSRFLDRHGDGYDETRDFPADDTTSRLSPYLAIGALSTRQCVAAAAERNGGRLDGGSAGIDTWITELIWREFYRHVLVGFPRVCRHQAFRPETDRVRWRESDDDLAAWCEGRTGVPIVDAAMRQLLETGWMHNRLRMVVAMYFSKDLFLDWRLGERHFMRHLVDGDLASNNGGWQWSASTGTDAAPYFRIFNPIRQSERFDRDGTFIRRYVPELHELDAKTIHDPAPLDRERLGYPREISDRKKSKDRVLKAFKAVK